MVQSNVAALRREFPVRLVHIGFHKTASTFIQRRYLNSLDEVTLLNDGQSPFDVDQWFFTHFVNACPFRFDAEEFAGQFREVLQTRGHATPDSTLVISDENLSGDIYSGTDAHELMHRVHDVFPQSDVLIVIRNQLDFLLSAYSNYVLHGGKDSLKRWVFSAGTRWGLILQKIHYRSLIESYQQVFGADRVHVVFYEELWSADSGIPALMNKLGVRSAAKANLKSRREMPGRSLLGNFLMSRLNCFGLWRIPYRAHMFRIFRQQSWERGYVTKLLGKHFDAIVEDNWALAELLDTKLPESYFR